MWHIIQASHVWIIRGVLGKKIHTGDALNSRPERILYKGKDRKKLYSALSKGKNPGIDLVFFQDFP